MRQVQSANCAACRIASSAPYGPKSGQPSRWTSSPASPKFIESPTGLTRPQTHTTTGGQSSPVQLGADSDPLWPSTDLPIAATGRSHSRALPQYAAVPTAAAGSANSEDGLCEGSCGPIGVPFRTHGGPTAQSAQSTTRTGWSYRPAQLAACSNIQLMRRSNRRKMRRQHRVCNIQHAAERHLD